VSVFVKICGNTSEEDALLAVAMGADAVGFVFAPSPRQVQPPLVADIVKRLPPEIMTVGVFRAEVPERVIDIMHKTGLHAAQLHGHEGPDVTRAVKEHVRFVIKGFSAAERAVDQYAEHRADAILIDAPNPGSGQLFDWTLSDRVSERTRLMLAGGLTADNVAEAIAVVQPWAVDVSTGVESTPGHKDAVKLRAFIAAAKAAVVDEHEFERDTGLEDRPFDWRTDNWRGDR
jgi:phosphoribosylanthranilate isomerase